MSSNKDVQGTGYREFLERKHSSFSTSPELIAQVINKATNSNLLTDERIVEGEVNEVHRITTNSGDGVIVRISRSSKPRFESERWAIENARKVGVPAPEVLLLEKYQTKKDGGNGRKIKKEKAIAEALSF